MMDRQVLIDTIGQETRRLVLEDGKPVELAYAYATGQRLTGNVYLGRVERVLPGMHAAFVDIGLGKNAFLPLDEIPASAKDIQSVQVSKPVLKGGQSVLVQVTREPGGEKGPRVSMNPSFPGQYVVLLPTVDAVGVSRHIQGTSAREALETIGHAHRPAGMGVVLRTASADAAEADIAAEIRDLSADWVKLHKSAAAMRPPALLWDEGDLIHRAERDLNAPIHKGAFPDEIETKLEKALRRKVWLDSGAYLVIDHAEALTIMDVNSGKNTGKRDLDSSLLRLNIEAATEAARQIRLRDIGGIIIIDFVDMRSDTDRQAVLDAFCQAMAPDRGKRHVHGFTAAGLLELTRRPIWQPLLDTTTILCLCCGEGHVPRPETAAHTLLRQIHKVRAHGDNGLLHFDLAPETAHCLRQIGLPENVQIHEKEPMHEPNGAPCYHGS